MCADVPPEWTQATTIGDDDGEVASGWLCAGIITLALVADYVIFQFLLDANYVHWYVANGAELALVLTVFALAVKLDDERGLVSAHPAQYVGAWFAFFGQGFMWLSGLLKPGSGTSNPGSVPFWDSLVTLLFCLAWSVVAFVWLLVVAPAQYCVSLVCGAPVRMTLSTKLATVESTPRKKPRSGRTWIPVGAQTLDLGSNVREKPVTATAAISAAALFGLSFAV